MRWTDHGNEITFDGCSWSAPVQIDPFEALRSLSCPASSFCVAVDAEGNALSASLPEAQPGPPSEQTPPAKTVLPPAEARPIRARRSHVHARARAGGPRRGTTFSFELNELATVTIDIQRRLPGHETVHGCGSAKGRRGGTRCSSYVTLATLTRRAHPGANEVAFSGRVRGKALSPGRYRAVFAASPAGAASRTRTISFRIVSGRAR